MAWTVIATRSNHEGKVQRELTRLGVRSYVPEYWNGARRLKLFPGYVFVWIPRIWQGIVKVVGVIRVFLVGDNLAKLEKGYVENLRKDENCNGCIELGKVKWKVGQKLRMLRGIFIDKVMTFLAQSGRMVDVAAGFLGKQCKLTFPSDWFLAV